MNNEKTESLYLIFGTALAFAFCFLDVLFSSPEWLQEHASDLDNGS